MRMFVCPFQQLLYHLQLINRLVLSVDLNVQMLNLFDVHV